MTTKKLPKIWLICIASIALSLTIFFSAACQAQSSDSTKNGTKLFFQKLVGEWIGTCEQNTDGQKAEDKYFHMLIEQVDENNFSGYLEYFRCDPKNGSPIPMGKSTIAVAIGSDGNATSSITGKGIVMVDKKPKNQEHKLSDVLTCMDSGCLKGKGGGTISVDGMPFGVGKNGKIKNAESTWSIENGTFTMNQAITVGFKVLIFKKNVKFDARYTATHGTDVASLMQNAYASLH